MQEKYIKSGGEGILKQALGNAPWPAEHCTMWTNALWTNATPEQCYLHKGEGQAPVGILESIKKIVLWRSGSLGRLCAQ
jgi:hypothetical protein